MGRGRNQEHPHEQHHIIYDPHAILQRSSCDSHAILVRVGCASDAAAWRGPIRSIRKKYDALKYTLKNLETLLYDLSLAREPSDPEQACRSSHACALRIRMQAPLIPCAIPVR